MKPTVQKITSSNSEAWDIAEKVRTDLDRQSCPGVYMDIAMESIVKHLSKPMVEKVDLEDPVNKLTAENSALKLKLLQMPRNPVGQWMGDAVEWIENPLKLPVGTSIYIEPVLEQKRGEVVVTRNESGAIVAVTRQDEEGRILSIIAEA
jgi:hypothetical protein